MNRIPTFAFRMFLIAALVTGFNACKKDDNNNNNNDRVVKNGIVLEALQEGPSVTSSGSGTIDIDYTKSTKMLMYTVKWNGLTGNASAMHFHGPASRLETAPPVVPVTGFTQSTTGSYSGMATLTAEQETQFLGNKWYFNIHTPNYGGGEIRGQIEF